MNFSKLEKYLDIPEIEIFYRIKRFEMNIFKLLKETKSDQQIVEIRFNQRDIIVISAIAKNCRNNNKLINLDVLLEIIILYYCIMEIILDKHSTGVLENYFEIPNFTSILIENIGSFSKPYVQSIMKQRIN